MAITQERLLAILAAARDFKGNWGNCQEAVREAGALAIADNADYFDILQRLLGQIQSYQPQMTSVEILAAETAHFRKVARANDLVRIRRQQRALGELPPTPPPKKPRKEREFRPIQPGTPDPNPLHQRATRTAHATSAFVRTELSDQFDVPQDFDSRTTDTPDQLFTTPTSDLAVPLDPARQAEIDAELERMERAATLSDSITNSNKT